MREELFWDREKETISPEIEIERAINFGGFEFIEEVQKKHGMAKFAEQLMKSKNLSKKSCELLVSCSWHQTDTNLYI